MNGADPTAVERVLGYRFRNRTLRSALLPPSPARPDPTAFQRLEFLGDRVLGLLLTERLFAEYPDAPEGALSIRLSYLASGEVLALVARESGLADAVAQDPHTGGRWEIAWKRRWAPSGATAGPRSRGASCGAT